MWQVTDRFLEAIRGPHKLVCVVDVLDGGNPVEGFDNLPVVAGQVNRDRTAAHFASCTLQVSAPDLAPLTAQSPLSPAGFEIAVQVGVEYTDGTQELVPVFVGGIQSATVDATTKNTQINAVDRSKRVADALLEQDVRTLAADPAGVMLTLIRGDAGGRGPVFNHTFVYDYEAATNLSNDSTAIYEVGSDRWAICQDIAKAHGFESFFDGQGTWVLRDEPDVTTTTPVFTFDEGDAGVLIDALLTWDREPAINRAIVTGTNTEFDVTYTGVATDSDPGSPSYYGTNDSPSRFGHKPIFFASAHVDSTAAATTAAQKLLAAKQGLPMSFDLSAAPNYALVPGDVALIESDRLAVDVPAVIDAITLGLGPEDGMTVSVRARQESTPEV